MSSNRKKKTITSLKKNEKVVLGIPEPVRESIFDILCDNLTRAQRNIFLNRIIYIGEHTFEDVMEGYVNDMFRKTIKHVNTTYNDENLTGVFLYYTKFFVHMLEGSEDSIMKHFQILKEDANSEKVTKMKLIIVLNHINQRFIDDWIDIPGKPNTLLEKIDLDSDMEKSGRHVFNFIQKVYQLCNEIREIQNNQDELGSQLRGADRISSSVVTDEEADYEDALRAYYPETNLLQFLIQTRFLKDIEAYIDNYGFPVISDDYDDRTWPIPSTMIRYTIFSKPLDICVDLPSHKAAAAAAKEEDVLIGEEPHIIESTTE